MPSDYDGFAVTYESDAGIMLSVGAGVSVKVYAVSNQVETNTVVAGAGITSNGNARSIVTAAGMTGSPKTVTVAVTTGAHTTAALIATAFRTALAADANVGAFFTVGGTGADITLTTKTVAAADATMNFTIEDVTSAGITDDTTSTNTVQGAGDVAESPLTTDADGEIAAGTLAAVAADTVVHFRVENFNGMAFSTSQRTT